MRIVIDSICDDIARVEFDTVMVDIPRALIPADCKEGDVLGFVKLDNEQILADAQARIDRMKAMSGNCSGDIDL